MNKTLEMESSAAQDQHHKTKITDLEQQLEKSQFVKQMSELKGKLIAARQDYFNFLTEQDRTEEAQALLKEHPEIENLHTDSAAA